MQENKQPSEIQGELPEAPEQANSGARADASPATEQAGDPADVMPGLAETLRQAELKAAEHHDAWLRARADVENVRRRAQEDIAKAAKFAAEKFATAMLPVKDSLEAALANERQTIESLREGVELTLRQLNSAFQSAGVAEDNPAGTKFDPNRHQAISVVEAEGEPNTVVNVLQKGYLLHDRVIRPAMVMVSKAKGA